MSSPSPLPPQGSTSLGLPPAPLYRQNTVQSSPRGRGTGFARRKQKATSFCPFHSARILPETPIHQLGNLKAGGGHRGRQVSHCVLTLLSLHSCLLLGIPSTPARVQMGQRGRRKKGQGRSHLTYKTVLRHPCPLDLACSKCEVSLSSGTHACSPVCDSFHVGDASPTGGFWPPPPPVLRQEQRLQSSQHPSAWPPPAQRK